MKPGCLFTQLFSIVLLTLCVQQVSEGKQVKREESVALLKELGANQLVSPTIVSIEHRLPDTYLLKIKGEYFRQEIGAFLANRGFSYEENKDYLVIS